MDTVAGGAEAGGFVVGVAARAYRERAGPCGFVSRPTPAPPAATRLLLVRGNRRRRRLRVGIVVRRAVLGVVREGIDDALATGRLGEHLAQRRRHTPSVTLLQISELGLERGDLGVEGEQLALGRQAQPEQVERLMRGEPRGSGGRQQERREDCQP